MSRARAILAALMFAVFFQGYAAASMAYCSTGHEKATVVTGKLNSESLDHSNHQRASGDPDFSADDLDAAHKCGTCGACHAVALTSAPHASPTHLLPKADLAKPFSILATRSPHVLDKPPRG